MGKHKANVIYQIGGREIRIQVRGKVEKNQSLTKTQYREIYFSASKES